MAKAPRLGLAKTRLAACVGRPEAARLYRLMLAGLLRELASDARWRCHLALTPRRMLANIGLQHLPGLHVMAQGGGDLGARMEDLLRRLPSGAVVFVGSDIPGIRRRHVAQAFAALGSHDAVFGPAEDGGYWLVGLRRRPATRSPFGLAAPVFANVRWSTPRALADTMANLAGRRVALLEHLADIDDSADLQRWRDGLTSA